MKYYDVAIADRSYGGHTLLTYCHNFALKSGQVVVIKLRSKIVNGFIIREVKKPKYKLTEISQIYDDLILPEKLVSFYLSIIQYYPGNIGATGSMFLPALSKKMIIPKIDNTKNVLKKNNSLLMPTAQQKTIINKITSSKTQTHIVHGDTGTGKTLVYLKLAKQVNKQNKSVIILTPEISLTPQITEQFYEQFEQVHVIHSALTIKEKRETWTKILLSDKASVVIGARSALFTPIKNLGLVVIDEFHEDAYKQDQSPKYRATRLAGMLAKLHGSKLVLGSATPPVDEYFLAQSVGAEVHRLTEKPNNYSEQNIIKYVNLNDKNESTKYDLISKTALEMIEQTLKNNMQTIVFHNRRGTSRTVFCENCGYIETCNRCNIPYIYHSDKNALFCHTCTQTKPLSINCPKCGSASVLFKNPGTKHIEESLKKAFPKANIARYDKDNKKVDTFHANYEDIKSGKVDILVGTQLLTKGHDLPKLELAINLLSNSSLSFPDYSSSEKNFQQTSQLIGRVGRRGKPGNVIVQFFGGNNNSLHSTEQKNMSWEEFYTEELASRKQYNYPPFVYMLKIETQRSSRTKAIEACSMLIDDLKSKYKDVEIIGPGPSLIEQKSGKWHWQIIIKASQRSKLAEIAKQIPANFTYDLDPVNLL